MQTKTLLFNKKGVENFANSAGVSDMDNLMGNLKKI